jgi:flagellar biosynthesis protein FlhF
MQIKRFEATTVQEALRQVKETLGPEAIILSSKTIRKASSIFGLAGRPAAEVVAAIDRPSSSPVPSSADGESPSKPGPGYRNEPGGEEGDLFARRVLSAGFVPELVDDLLNGIQTLRKECRGGDLARAYQGYLQWKVMETVEVFEPDLGERKIWSLIGPTGVGKTTTIAKLAALCRMRGLKKITLVNLDTYRIGASEQLKTYGRILRLPLETAAHRDELGRIIEKHRNQDLLLIDTTGRSPGNTEQIEDLRNMLTVHPDIENHLLLSATTKDRDMDQIVQRFGRVPIKSYLFTKIDETEDYAPVFNQLFRCRKPLYYLTHGQNVPDDIEPASRKKMAHLMLKTIQWS